MDISAIVDLVRSSPAIRGIAAGMAMYGLLRAYSRQESLSTGGKRLLGLAAGMLAMLGLAVCLRQVAQNFLNLRDWDFLCFWTYGRALALGKSPYDVTTLKEIAAPLGPSSEFLAINVCLYPPICLPLFWPFGYLPFTASLVVWFAVQIAALVGSLLLLLRLWNPERTWLGLVVLLAMFFPWHATQLTLLYGQTNFLFMLAILGLVLLQSPTSRGMSLGLAIIVKPIALILLIDVLLRRQWRTILAVCIPPLIALGVFLLIQGSSGLARYLERDSSDVAFAYYDSFFNQSLLGVLLRWFDSPALTRPVLFPPYVVLAGLLTIATVIILLRMPQELAAHRIGYVLLLALMVYPGTQMYYSIWLLIPLAMLWRDRHSFASGQSVAPLAIAVAFGLGWSRWNFAAHLAIWVLLTALFSLRRPVAIQNQRSELQLVESA